MYTKKLPMAAPDNPAMILISWTRIATKHAAINIPTTKGPCVRSGSFRRDVYPCAAAACFNPSLAPLETRGKPKMTETCYGKTLVTDGKTQSTYLDKFAYHECLVHPSLLLHNLLSSTSTSPSTSKQKSNSKTKTVFIGGGGELATAREVLKHPSVSRVVMVDLDATVIEVCKRHLPEWGGERVASDPRLELIVGFNFENL
mmetsp:Transcript_11293/g.15942  ORF Transcript_11293/g.15942 Transcript_11293/m.15942 type:complete len:201 (-) Transcript_11293:102-704(-)